MSSNDNDVAIIIAAYNAENSIQKAVTSALVQKNVSQVIVVDDASKDQTTQNAQACDDNTGRLLVLTQSENQGPAAARNVALKKTTAAWFTVLDADDYLLEDRIQHLVELNENNYDLLADDLWLLTEGHSEDKKYPMLGIESAHSPSPLNLPTFILGNIPQKNKNRRELGFLKPIIRMKCLRDANLSYDEKMRLGEDYDLYVRLFAHGAKAGLISTQGYIAVRRYNSLSGQHGYMELKHLYDCTRSHQTLPNLSPASRSAMRKARSSVSRRYRWAKMINDKKTKNIAGFLSCFFTSPKNIAFLCRNLTNSVIDRTFKKPRRRKAST